MGSNPTLSSKMNKLVKSKIKMSAFPIEAHADIIVVCYECHLVWNCWGMAMAEGKVEEHMIKEHANSFKYEIVKET